MYLYIYVILGLMQYSFQAIKLVLPAEDQAVGLWSKGHSIVYSRKPFVGVGRAESRDGPKATAVFWKSCSGKS
jgi:hypothetical protein